MQGIHAVLLGEGDHGDAGLGSSHGRDEDLGRVVLVEPEDQFVAGAVARLDEAVGEGAGVPVEFLHGPVEALLVEAHGVEHVVRGDGDLELASHRISRKLGIHYQTNKGYNEYKMVRPITHPIAASSMILDLSSRAAVKPQKNEHSLTFNGEIPAPNALVSEE